MSRPPSASPLDADALGVVPISYLPTGRLVDSLDARVSHPSAHCAVWRATTSQSLVSSARRSPTRCSIGRTLLAARAAGSLFFSEHGLVIHADLLGHRNIG